MFNEKWGVPLEAYLESMDECLACGLDRWYMAMDGDRIIAACDSGKLRLSGHQLPRPKACRGLLS